MSRFCVGVPTRKGGCVKVGGWWLKTQRWSVKKMSQTDRNNSEFVFNSEALAERFDASASLQTLQFMGFKTYRAKQVVLHVRAERNAQRL